MSARPDTPHTDTTYGAREIVLYSRPGCPYCFTLRAGSRRSGPAFREINIWDDPDAAAFVRSVADGNEIVPTVVVGDVHMVNPGAQRVRAVAAQANGVPAATRRRWLHRGAQAGKTP